LHPWISTKNPQFKAFQIQGLLEPAVAAFVMGNALSFVPDLHADRADLRHANRSGFLEAPSHEEEATDARKSHRKAAKTPRNAKKALKKEDAAQR
jgi:hypothetical protein